jgi:mobilome CxxCx(11)CxxC protein
MRARKTSSAVELIVEPVEGTPVAERKDIEAKRRTCWDKALQAYGTAYIFRQRASKLLLALRVVKFLGVAVPLVIGFIATKVYSKDPVPEEIMFVASVLSLALLLTSVWSLVAKWDDAYAEALQASHRNADLQQKWEVLAKEHADVLLAKFDDLLADDAKQGEADVKQLPTEKEKRRGMRAGLLRYQRQCAGCKQIPTSMSTKGRTCGVCC